MITMLSWELVLYNPKTEGIANMEEVNKLLYTAFAAIMFCIGTFLLLYGAKQYNKGLDTVRSSYIDSDTMYQQYTSNNEDIVPSAELIATLLNTLEYDIWIDSVLISKGEHSREKITGYGIRNIDYQKTYNYDNYGNITGITYTGISG